MPPPTLVADHSRKRKAAAATASYLTTSSSPTPEADDEDVDYRPTQNKRQARPSGGKSSGKGAMSREQLRKANHSLIERRRREKINSCLAELREMVPGLSGESNGGEFKLEVLERTVSYMQTLTSRIEALEARLASWSSGADPSIDSARTLPSPKSLSADPDETETEGELPPPFTLASPSPSIASLIHAADNSKQSSPPPPGSSANLYLPFPTPSPTSPFLSCHTSTLSHVGSSASGPPSMEPSPFIAPLQNIGLFGGIITLDADKGDKPGGNGRGKNGGRVMPAEEAANLLLAFSSPDAMRPTIGLGSGLTPKMVPATQESIDGQLRERRDTGASDEFVLDGGVRSASEDEPRGPHDNWVVGKTARDILRMK